VDIADMCSTAECSHLTDYAASISQLVMNCLKRHHGVFRHALGPQKWAFIPRGAAVNDIPHDLPKPGLVPRQPFLSKRVPVAQTYFVRAQDVPPGVARCRLARAHKLTEALKVVGRDVAWSPQGG
jgi:hypothetical protein